MATFYIQLQDKLLQISGDLTAENISKALGYVPVSPNVTNELSQRVDNITFDSLKDNPFLQDGSGELNIVDEAGNIIAKIDAYGIHSVDFIAGNHKLTDKIDSSALNGYAKESWVTAEITKAATEGKVDLTGYATEEYVNNIDFYNINNNPIVNNGDGKLLFVDENGYIGLQLEENGLYVKDVIADGHTLSQKADKSDIPSLEGYATESYVNTNLQNYATKDEVSDLVDMSVVTELQGKVNTLIDTDADKSVRDIAVDVLTETLVSETATEAYDTLAEMSAWIKSHPEDASAMNTTIQKNATDIQSNATAIYNLDAAYKAADTKVLTDAQEYTDNINFYTIKDNPIVDGEAGSITFVDETGYIGLKVTEDGIIAKDVVTPEHTLSSKADKSFVEDNYYNKSTVDKKITEAVTGGQVSLDGFATEQWVNEQGFLKTHQDISHLAEKSELPTKVSDLTNDSGFITIDDVPEVTVPTKVSELENDKGYLTEHQDISHLATKTEINEINSTITDNEFVTANAITNIDNRITILEEIDFNNFVNKNELPTVPTKVSELENDSNFITIEDVPEVTVPTKVSDLTNDSGFITIEDVPVLEIPDEYATKEWVNNKNYATEYDLKTIDYSSINNTPTLEDETGELNITDENGNIGMKVSSEAVYAKDFIAGGHKLSEKINKDYVDNSIAEIVDGAPETLNTLNELAAALKDNADIVDVLNQSISSKQDKLVSGTNIKTINGESIIGEGDIVISAGSESTSVDWEDVQNKPKISITDVGDLKINSNAFVDIKGEYGITLTGPIYFEENTDCDGIGIVKNNTQLNWNSYGIQLIDTNDDGILSISCTGDGSKFLSNDGTYKEISGGSSAYPLINHGTSDTTFTLTSNTFHVWDEVSALTLTLGSETSGVANEYLFQFTSASEPTTLILPESIKFNSDFTVEENNIYQISILNGLGTVMSWDIEPTIQLITFTIDGTEYQAEEGMTWEYWCASKYNTNGFEIMYNEVWKNDRYYIRMNKISVIYSDMIYADTDYELKDDW